MIDHAYTYWLRTPCDHVTAAASSCAAADVKAFAERNTCAVCHDDSDADADNYYLCAGFVRSTHIQSTMCVCVCACLVRELITNAAARLSNPHLIAPTQRL